MDIIKYSLWALCNLAQIPTLATKLGQLGTCQLLVTIGFNFFERQEAVAHLICVCMACLCLINANKSLFVDRDALNLLARMETFYGSKNAKSNLVSAIRTAKSRLESPGIESEPMTWDISNSDDGFSLRIVPKEYLNDPTGMTPVTTTNHRRPSGGSSSGSISLTSASFAAQNNDSNGKIGSSSSQQRPTSSPLIRSRTQNNVTQSVTASPLETTTNTKTTSSPVANARTESAEDKGKLASGVMNAVNKFKFGLLTKKS
jgi:hypothetical protein